MGFNGTEIKIYQFNNYGLQLYTAQKGIMSDVVGLFHTNISLTIIDSNYIKHKNISIIINR